MKVTDKITITNEDNMLLMARYPDNYFDLAIVDPPYGIGASNDSPHHIHPKKDWDNKMPSKEYFNELFRVSKNQIIWGANYFTKNINPTRGFIVWVKPNVVYLPTMADCELAFTSFDRNSKIINLSSASEKRIHITQKPTKLYKWLLDNYAKQGDKILDTHLGSGSIAIASHDYGFELTACELDKEYYDKAIQRITNHTNQQKLF
jgi:site-specific DNA-methyltransferase (adenine-specific)